MTGTSRAGQAPAPEGRRCDLARRIAVPPSRSIDSPAHDDDRAATLRSAGAKAAYLWPCCARPSLDASLEETQRLRAGDRIPSALDLQLAVDALSVLLDGERGDVERRRDLLIREPTTE